MRDGVPILLIVVIALVVIRLARLFVHGIVKALLDRETTEGTAQELSAVEIRKRMDTLETLGDQRHPRCSSSSIALVMILGELDLDIGPASPGSASWASPSGSGPRASSATTSPAP